jgi:O-antigen biosynthesis protein WbqL
LAEVLDLSAAPPIPLEQAMRLRAGEGRVLLFPGGDAVAPRPLLWRCADGEVGAPHLTPAAAFPVELHAAADVLVGGRGGHAQRNGAYLHATGANPNYVGQWIAADIDREVWAFEPAQPTRRLDTAFALAHFNLVYGHWLTEVFPKLFTIARLAELGVSAPILLPSTVPPHVRTVIADVLPRQAVETYDPEAGEQVRVERLLLPGMMQHDYVFHPELGRRLDSYVRPRSGGRSGRNLFISRGRLGDQPSFRRLENAREIEAVAARLGLEIVHPERLPWREQVALFGGARLIVGEYGSGLHGALFAPADARVVGLNWIAPGIQSHICNFRGQRIGYILDPDGRPRSWSHDAPLQGYRIDPAAFRRRVAPLLDGRAGPRRWFGR